MHTVADVMTRDLFALGPETSLTTAARMLASQHISGAPVVDANGAPVGVLSLSDLVDPDRPHTQRTGHSKFFRLGPTIREQLVDGAEAQSGLVADIMSPVVLSIESNETIETAARRMIAEKVHRLLVMEDGRLVGIVTSFDVMSGFVSQSILDDLDPERTEIDFDVSAH